ncbi:disease resistance protein RPV1-like, partial [Syzygium oleosum]|uniref:disease resistance protein RPV1-like n=1 Tax=Syzygium oleosum TaxID=219896 RepID=UPI0024BA5702
VSQVLLHKDISHVTNHSSLMSRRPPPEVFLSFRGPDTRRHFANFLHIMLTGAGIDVFIDDEDLVKGKDLWDGLIEAIDQSKISIAVISKDYASSKSCLMELEQMLKCVDNGDHIIIPIFYYVEPSDVRYCKGPFETSLLGHKHRRIKDTVIGSWKAALHRIGNMDGHHLHEKNEVIHVKLIKQIFREVQQNLKKEDLTVPDHLVGVDPHVPGIMAKLKVDYCNGKVTKIGDKREKVLGIYGITGVGKTVLAKYVYNQLLHLYDACSFCEKIQAEIEHDCVLSVQNKLISHLHKGNAEKFDSSDKALIHIQNRFRTMKVLLLLDDVNNDEQLSALVGKLDWLGPGSRVIVTSQRRDVLKNINGAESFVLERMEKDDALKLFCRHAFGMDFPLEKFRTLSKEMVEATDRLPFALKLVGSSLSLVKKEKAWKETLNALQVAPHKRVQAALKKSYTNLDKNEQEIFLDIACFFIGKDKRIPSYMWHDCKYCPYISIPALDVWSFVKIGEDKELCMHEILKNFGREIVIKENQREPSKRSRLYDHKDALHVLKKRKGNNKVEALSLEYRHGSKGNISFKSDRFDGLQNLRFLKLDQADIQGNFGRRLSSLRWLDWQGCPKIFDVQSLNLNLKNLVILDLSWSQVDKDWRGWKLLVQAKKLKVLKLTGCVQLIATPNFPPSMKLERLILEGCLKLAVTDSSFRNLKELVSLNMKQCSPLYELPDLGHIRGLKELVIDGTSIARINFQEGSMRKLKILSACDCKKLTEISDSIRSLKSLTNLALDGTEIDTLWEDIGSLGELKTLSLKNCRRLSRLPDGIGKLRSLQFLDLSHTMIQKLPPSVKDLKAMKVLRMRDTFIREFPEAILNLEKLEEIDFSLCQSLEGRIPSKIWRLSSLAILKLSDTKISGLPTTLHRLPCLQELDIFRCDNLRRLCNVPSSLIVRGR